MSTDESLLIQSAQRGDVGAFEELIRGYQTRLHRLILVLAGDQDDAEDALQESLLKVFRALPTFRGEAAFSTWLHRIAINATRNWIRSQARASSDRIGQRLVLTGIPAPPSPESVLLEHDRHQVLRDAIRSLPWHYRAALVMRHYQDMSYEQIADALDIPVGTVRSRIAQGRRLLAQSLEKSGYYPPRKGEAQ